MISLIFASRRAMAVQEVRGSSIILGNAGGKPFVSDRKVFDLIFHEICCCRE